MGKQLKTFKSEFIGNHKNIMIPLLQRDYVQGGRLDVISPLLDKLISAFTTENEKVSLNYIYGYNYDEKFVPIDGQQRLITLWLLHLYIYARLQKMSEFEVKLQFESREFAHDFCEELPKKLVEILKEKSQRKAAYYCRQKSLKEMIVDSDWFVLGWQQDTTVENMLKTLQLIDDKLCGKDLRDVHENNIVFDFKELANGLDDDIYVKMNGRGRSLSYFENLKSWMDKHVQTLFGNNDDFTKQWQIKMDNDWTDLFWKNRNKKKEKPEEIDDEWMRFLYSMLLLYWIQDDNNSCFLESFRVNEGESQDDVKSGYIAFLNEWRREEDKKLPDNATADQLRERTFSLLQKGDKMIPLYWIEKINIFGKEDVFKFISNSLDTLVSINEKINGICKDFVKSLDFDDETTVLYQIAFKDATYNKTLPLLYALVNSEKEELGSVTSFFDWMRVMRNLILGTDIKKDNISSILKSIHKLSVLCKKMNIYELLTGGTLKEEVSGFDKSQVEEEIRKAQWIVEDNEWVEVFNELESIAFCKGTINFIFNFLPEQKNKQIFKKYSTLVHLLFGRTGSRYTIPDYNLQRSLMCFTTHYGFGFWSGGKWKFMNDRSWWHKFLNDSEECEGQPHNQCMKSLLDYLYKDLSESLDLSHYSEDYSKIINRELLSIIKNNNIEDWRYYFIKYPSIWSEMLDSMCCWENDYNIILLHRTQNRDKSKSELRSYAFWQDVLSDRNNNPNDYANWEYPQFFKEGDTCMCINHTCNSRRVVAINLFYERGKANQYRFRMFYRSNEFEESEKTHLATFEDLKAIAIDYGFKFNEEDHKYYSPYYSYEKAMEVFKGLMKELGEI